MDNVLHKNFDEYNQILNSNEKNKRRNILNNNNKNINEEFEKDKISIARNSSDSFDIRSSKESPPIINN